MATATMTTLDAILKEVYEGRIVDQANEETVARKRIERTSRGVTTTAGGKYVDFPIHVSRNTGVGWRRELEALPEAGNQGYAEVHVPLQYGYARIKVTGQVMDLADSDPQAFASGFDEEMSRVKDDVAKDDNRITYGDGSGLLATVTADGANTVTVDNAQYLEAGMRIDILVKATGSAVGGFVNRHIVSATEAGVVTYDGADAAVTADGTMGLYREGNYLSGTKREPSGFSNIVSDTVTLHGLTVAAQPKWAATIHGNSGTPRALSEGLMIALCDAVRKKSGKKVTVILGSLGARRAYFNLLTQQRRYTDTKEYAGGFQGLPFNYGTEIPMVEDVDAPETTTSTKLYFLHEPSFKIYRTKDWHWMDKDGTILKWVDGYDAWTGAMKKYEEFATNQRNSNGALTDLIPG